MLTTTLALLAAVAIEACPRVMSDVQTAAGVDGWQARIRDREHKLDYMRVYESDPSERQELIPQEIGRTYRWDGIDSVAWVECFYDDSSVVLVRDMGVVGSCLLTRPAPGSDEPSVAVCTPVE